MREWLSGGAPPCQGGGRGFDPRLALEKKNDTKSVSFFFSSPARARKFDVYAPLRSALLLFAAEALILQGFLSFCVCMKL